MSFAFQGAGFAFQRTGFAFQQDASSQYPKPAGRKGKRRFVVEIDGQTFPVESIQQAQALLDQAREIALKRAKVVADAVVRQKIQDKPPTGKPIRVPVPQLHTDNQELVDIVIRARHSIAKIYREQALAAEIRIRLELQELENDDDDLMLFL